MFLTFYSKYIHFLTQRLSTQLAVHVYLCVFQEHSVSTKVHSFLCGCDGGLPYLNHAPFVLHPSSCVLEIEISTKVVENLSELGPLSFHV